MYWQSNNEGFFHTVLQLHRNFLLKKEKILGVEGKHYVAWVGLIASAISLLGLWLWWPLRRSFAIQDLVPRGKKRQHFYYSHMSNGVVVLVVILLLTLTGASIAYRAFTQQLFGVESEPVSSVEPISIDANWHSWMQAAYAQMPAGAKLNQIRFPRQTVDDTSQQILELRFHTLGDWLGLTGSKAKIDKQSSQLVEVILFHDLALGEKFYSILVPLHTGHNLPTAYVAVLLILSFFWHVDGLLGFGEFFDKEKKMVKDKSFV